MAVTTFAAIDIGSYNVSMEIFELTKKSGLRSLTRVRQGLELGSDTFALRKISMERLEELTKILLDYRRIMKEYGVSGYRACAKSAFREAGNRYLAVDHIKRAAGIEIEVLSNSEQRFLGYKSIASRGEEFQKYIEKGTAIVDVGGGSIQISLFDKDSLVTTQNILLGSLRVRERLSPFEKETIHYDRLVEQLIHRDISNFKRMYLNNRKVENIILVGDYFTNLIFQNRNDSSKTESRETFMKWYDHVVGSAPKEIAEELGISAEVSSVLIPMAVLYRTLIEELQVETIWLPGIQLTDGIAYDYGEKKKIIRASHDFEQDILEAAKNMARRYAVSKPHSESIARTARALYSSVRKAANLSQRAALLLEVCCYLNDCGSYISLVNVEECSYNIIMSTEIIGLSETERRIIANVVRYTTKELSAFQDLRSTEFLTHEDYMTVAQLAAIMRLASALDKSHLQKLEEVSAARKDRELVITVKTSEDFTLEKGIFEENTDFFEEIFNLKPVLKMKGGR